MARECAKKKGEGAHWLERAPGRSFAAFDVRVLDAVREKYYPKNTDAPSLFSYGFASRSEGDLLVF